MRSTKASRNVFLSAQSPVFVRFASLFPTVSRNSARFRGLVCCSLILIARHHSGHCSSPRVVLGYVCVDTSRITSDKMSIRLPFRAAPYSTFFFRNAFVISEKACFEAIMLPSCHPLCLNLIEMSRVICHLTDKMHTRKRCGMEMG